MATRAIERLQRVANRHTLCLTHYGRKSGRPYEVTIWYLVDKGKMYLVSANAARNWVRNVKARPNVSLRIGNEIFNGDLRTVVDPEEREHVSSLVDRKYWFVMPLMRAARMLTAMGIMRDNSAAFEVLLSDN
jgi:deazaflavin-dependent oxidoreductase (nitroreductase family)